MDVARLLNPDSVENYPPDLRSNPDCAAGRLNQDLESAKKSKQNKTLLHKSARNTIIIILHLCLSLKRLKLAQSDVKLGQLYVNNCYGGGGLKRREA